MSWHERLSGLDALFLQMEDRTAHMHVGAVFVYHGPPPPYADLLALIAARIDRLPRYRQRLAFPALGLARPAWIDDAHFDVEYHVRHTALPAPGGDDELKRLAARLFSQRLDRERPLWELWLVDGLGGGRFAVVSKTHHCMIDGMAGVELSSVVHDASADASPPPPPAPWTPRPAPDGASLMLASLAEKLTHPLAVVTEALEATAPGRTVLGELALGLKPLLGISRLGLAPASSLNQAIGSHRRWETASLDLGEVKRVRTALGGTVNDVVLAVVAGALRALLLARGEPLPEDLRAFVPVSMRARDDRSATGNQVAAVFCPLPVREPDAAERLHRISRAMADLKQSHQALGSMALTHLGELAPSALSSLSARLPMMTRWFNLVVTNVPGPQSPLYLLGRELLACHPLVPLTRSQTLSIALLSYNGSIGVGLLGDADKARDLPLLAAALPESLAELAARR